MDFIDDALKRYNAKMAMPQYEAYQNNEQMQQALWEDCLREAEFTAECRSRRINYESTGVNRETGTESRTQQKAGGNARYD